MAIRPCRDDADVAGLDGGAIGADPLMILYDDAAAPLSRAAAGDVAITTGGTAQTLFSGATPPNGWKVANPDAAEDLWVSDSTTAAVERPGLLSPARRRHHHHRARREARRPGQRLCRHHRPPHHREILVMSGNLLPAAATADRLRPAELVRQGVADGRIGFNRNTICFWGDSTTSNALDLFGGGAQPVCAPSFGTCRLGNLHQRAGEPLAGTRILNFGNNGSTLAAALGRQPDVRHRPGAVGEPADPVPVSVTPAVGDTVTIGADTWT